MNPYQELANAIVLQGAKDYKKALRLHYKWPEREEYEDNVLRLQRFFRSRWYEILTDLNGEYLLRKIEESVSKEGKR